VGAAAAAGAAEAGSKTRSASGRAASRSASGQTTSAGTTAVNPPAPPVAPPPAKYCGNCQATTSGCNGWYRNHHKGEGHLCMPCYSWAKKHGGEMRPAGAPVGRRRNTLPAGVGGAPQADGAQRQGSDAAAAGSAQGQGSAAAAAGSAQGQGSDAPTGAGGARVTRSTANDAAAVAGPAAEVRATLCKAMRGSCRPLQFAAAGRRLCVRCAK
jgi:hypothetical protein